MTAVPHLRPSALLTHPLFLVAVLLLPVVVFMPPLPIDETRYLAVAWEMRQTGEFLVPHVNGQWYSDKPPLLFWLLNLGWLVTGVHGWTGRVLALTYTLLVAGMLRVLARRLGVSDSGARAAQWVFLGSICLGFYAVGIMFDVLLTMCVMLALLGITDLEADRRRGILITGAAIGLGILAKGPVVLLDVAFVALSAPWWGDTAKTARGRYFGRLALALLLGIALGLAWAVPAALHGGPDYAHAIFLHQTVDRMSQSFAHQRPLYWYFWVLPLMVLPWWLVLRGRPSSLRTLRGERVVRFALVWFVPTFLVFSLISGKQPHYLLPSLPALALLAGAALGRDLLHVRTGLFGLLVVLLGLAGAWLPHYAIDAPRLIVAVDVWPAWGIGIAVIGAILFVGRDRWQSPAVPALGMLGVVLMAWGAWIQGPGERYDTADVAAQVRAAQDRGQPIVHLGWHHAVYEFAGRLTQPLPVIPLGELTAWAQQHPDGLVMSFYRRYRFRATPEYSAGFRGGEVGIWKVREALAAGIDPKNATGRSDGDFTPAEPEQDTDPD